VCCDTGPDFVTAQRAGEWVQRFYPDIYVTIDRAAARLASDQREATNLELIWQSSLANERLLVAGTAQRTNIIDKLMT
jgi:hypothetical protein